MQDIIQYLNNKAMSWGYYGTADEIIIKTVYNGIELSIDIVDENAFAKSIPLSVFKERLLAAYKSAIKDRIQSHLQTAKYNSLQAREWTTEFLTIKLEDL